MEKSLAEAFRRIEKLERAIFGPTKSRPPKQDFRGATGGLRFLASEGFFSRQRIFSEIENELRKHGYHYSKQAIQTPLNRMSKVGGMLVGMKVKGKKVYARRK